MQQYQRDGKTNAVTIMKKYSEIFFVSKASEFLEKMPIGIYPLNTVGMTGYKCGCGSYQDGDAPCKNHPTWAINYGNNVGVVYACDKHAGEF